VLLEISKNEENIFGGMLWCLH